MFLLERAAHRKHDEVSSEFKHSTFGPSTTHPHCHRVYGEARTPEAALSD